MAQQPQGPWGHNTSTPSSRISIWALIGGFLLGGVIGVVWLVLLFIAVLVWVDSSGRDFADLPDGFLGWLIMWLPAPFAVLLLCLPRTRKAGAGLVMGIAIGILSLAAWCWWLVLV